MTIRPDGCAAFGPILPALARMLQDRFRGATRHLGDVQALVESLSHILVSAEFRQGILISRCSIIDRTNKLIAPVHQLPAKLSFRAGTGFQQILGFSPQLPLNIMQPLVALNVPKHLRSIRTLAAKVIPQLGKPALIIIQRQL